MGKVTQKQASSSEEEEEREEDSSITAAGDHRLGEMRKLINCGNWQIVLKIIFLLLSIAVHTAHEDFR